MSHLPNENDKNNQLSDQMEQAFLRLMLQKQVEHDGERLLEQEQNLPEHTPTNEQINRLEKNILGKAEQTVPRKRLSKRMTMIIAAAVAVLVVSLAVAGAQKAREVRLQSNTSDIATEYALTDSEKRTWGFDYVPNDFVEIQYDVRASGFTFLYQNRKDDTQFFFFSAYPASQVVHVDTENAEYIEDIKINGMDGKISLKEGIISIVWGDTDMEKLFVFQSTLSREEALKVIENSHPI